MNKYDYDIICIGSGSAGGAAAFAIVGSSALFAIGHAYQGRRGVVSTFVLGLLLAGARSWSDSLLPPILAHLAVDATAGLAGRQPAGESGGAGTKAAPHSDSQVNTK